MAGAGVPVITLGAKMRRLSGDRGQYEVSSGLTYNIRLRLDLPSRYDKNFPLDVLSSVFLNLDLHVRCFRYNRMA